MTALLLILSFRNTARRRRWKATCFKKRSFSLDISVAPWRLKMLLNTGNKAFQKIRGWLREKKLINMDVMQSSFPKSVAMLWDAAIVENFSVISKTWRLTAALKFSSQSSWRNKAVISWLKGQKSSTEQISKKIKIDFQRENGYFSH